MEKQFQQKRKDFAISIRRGQRTKIIQELRKKYFKILPQSIQLTDLIDHFDLQEDSSFSKEQIQTNKFILVDILLARQQNLIRISFKKNLYNQQMIDQKLLPPIGSELELQEVPLPKQYAFRLHAALYQSLAEDIFTHKDKYKQLPKQLQKKMISFWLQLIKRNKYNETAQQKQYHQTLLSCLEWFVLEIQSPDLRNCILKWVNGTDSLRLIFNCLSGYFITKSNSFRIYDIILRGLKHKKLQTKIQAVQVLYKCTMNGDFDEVKSFLQQLPELLTQLIFFFDNQQLKVKIHESQDIVYSVKLGARAIQNLLKTYDQYIFKCLLQGAGYVGAKLVCMPQTALIDEGLGILSEIVWIQEQPSKQRCYEYLLYTNSSIYETGVWQRIGKTYQIVRHDNKDIKNKLISFIVRCLAHGSFEIMINLNNRFKYPNGESMVQMLIMMFEQNEDLVMRQNIVHCFQTIFYYEQKVRNYVNNMQIEQDTEQNYVSSLQIRYVLDRIYNSGMIGIIEKLQINEYYNEIGCNDLKVLFENFVSYIDSRNKQLN